MYKVCMSACIGDGCTVRYTLFLYSYIYIFIIYIKLIMILHIHLAVIHTFSISVSSPDRHKLQFRHLHPRIRQGFEYAQYYRTALLFKGFKEKNNSDNFFFSFGDLLIRIFRPRVVGEAWVGLSPSPPLDPLLLGGGDGLAFLGLYSYSVRANCTRTCNIQAGLKVCGTNTHSLVFFSVFVFLRIVP